MTYGTLTDPKKESTRTYTVRKVTEKPSLSGNSSDPVWKNAVGLNDFRYPWEQGNPPLTRFRAVHDNDWLYCLFEVTDAAVHIANETGDKTDAAASSRAEIFFKTDDRMHPYYCLEIDPTARVLDYEGFYHRRFDFSWSWPAGHLAVKTKQHPDGYSVAVAISKESLTNLGLLKNGALQAGLFRADCVHTEDRKSEFKWISWVNPESEYPDFHIPSAFGLLQLEE